MSQPLTSAIAANRFGLGARPGDLESIGADGRDWLRAQLKGAPPQIAAAQLRSSQEILVDAFGLRREQQAARKASAAAQSAAAGGEDAQATALLMKLPQFLRPIYMDEAIARLQLAATTERPFIERLTQFWTNHFAVSVDKQFLAGLAGSFEREAIRPHVLGNFTDLLLAAETHPAMLLYLDNHLSVGPNSPAAERLARRQTQRKLGINENLAREILELHTLGVGGGYTQQDVTTFAQVLTGWSIGGGAGRLFSDGAPGRFVFRAELHEPGAKVVLGRRYADEGFTQGSAVLREVARHSATAHFIATKLARHFIADEPPAPAVQQLADAFSRSGGDLPTVYRALIDAREGWQQALAKYKTPTDYIISTLRGLAQPVEPGKGLLAAFDLLGQRIWEPRSPAGWPDRSADWDGASALIKRIQWAEMLGERSGGQRDAVQLAAQLLGANLADSTRSAVAHAASGAQAVTLLLAAPEFMRR
ncbi:MAG TPA: DUF1800 domain-containing protein [Steroidobacteraceae bacterium]|jgi:uncharacterized protein (DUF1800 family)|nr:DUF1800 domain-containing protein [Steroidobacteraceae bacterium]